MKNTTIIFQVCPHTTTTTTIQHRTVKNFALLIDEERLSIYFRGRPKTRPRRKNITTNTTTTSSINTTIMGSSFSLLSSMSKSQSLFLILLVLCYLEMGTTLVSASEATVEAKIHDATGSTVNNNNQDDNDFKPDMKYLTESYQRLKRKASKAKDHVCDSAPNKNLCLPKSYSKFELPLPDRVNTVEIGIDIIDVLRINDKVSFQRFICQ